MPDFSAMLLKWLGWKRKWKINVKKEKKQVGGLRPHLLYQRCRMWKIRDGVIIKKRGCLSGKNASKDKSRPAMLGWCYIQNS